MTLNGYDDSRPPDSAPTLTNVGPAAIQQPLFEWPRSKSSGIPSAWQPIRSLTVLWWLSASRASRRSSTCTLWRLFSCASRWIQSASYRLEPTTSSRLNQQAPQGGFNNAPQRGYNYPPPGGFQPWPQVEYNTPQGGFGYTPQGGYINTPQGGSSNNAPQSSVPSKASPPTANSQSADASLAPTRDNESLASTNSYHARSQSNEAEHGDLAVRGESPETALVLYNGGQSVDNTPPNVGGGVPRLGRSIRDEIALLKDSNGSADPRY